MYHAWTNRNVLPLKCHGIVDGNDLHHVEDSFWITFLHYYFFYKSPHWEDILWRFLRKISRKLALYQRAILRPKYSMKQLDNSYLKNLTFPLAIFSLNCIDFIYENYCRLSVYRFVCLIAGVNRIKQYISNSVAVPKAVPLWKANTNHEI